MVDPIVADIRSRMVIGQDVDLDAYADHDEAAHIKPAEDYADVVWEHMHRDPRERGRTLPWTKTHGDIQIRGGELIVYGGQRKVGKSNVTGHIMAGLMGQGDKVVIASMEMPVVDTLERMEKQVLATGTPGRPGHDRFYQWAAGKLWLYEQGGVIPSRRILGLCNYSIQELGVQHVVIDSLMMIGMGNGRTFDKLEAQGLFARDLTAIARDTGATIHLVAHLRKADRGSNGVEADDVAGTSDITNLAGMVFLLSGNRKKREERNKPESEQKYQEQPDLWLKCEANRRGPSGSNYGFWMHPETFQITAKPDERHPMIS